MTRPQAEASAAHLARNAVDCLPQGALAERIAQGRPLRVKLGLDPTAPDIHVGHTVVLTKLREFQDAGHTVVLIVGDYTARVGDPSGRSVARPVLTGEQIDANAETYRRQAAKILRTDERLEVRRNAEWLDMPMEDLFRLARHPTVAQLLERDDFAKRWAAAEPISLLELLYPVLQGYDSVCVQADVELGGTDQTFNLLMGRSIQQAYGQAPQVVLTTPLLTGIDGTQKMSKSFGNQIGVTDASGRDVRQDAADPRRADRAVVLAAAGCRAARRRAPARRQAGARARARDPLPRREAAAVEAEAGFDRIFIAHELPQEIEEARRGGAERDGPPAGRDRRPLRPVAVGGAPDARAGRREAGRRGRWRPTRSTCPRASSTAACCSSESGISAACG